MRRSLRTCLLATVAALVVTSVGIGSSSAAERGPDRQPIPVRSCESLATAKFDNTTVTSATTVAATGATPEYCAVQAVVTNPPLYEDQVKVGVFLPTKTWNGRFQGTGGGGFSGGNPNAPSAEALQTGYVTAGTDTGHNGSSPTFAMDAAGNPNWPLINDFGYVGIHNMTVLAKQVTRSYYGRDATYSYFNGCSTGGRQGLIEAQRYGDDYDGIFAGSPAINSQKLRTAQSWGQLTMNLAGDFLPQCKFEAVNKAVTAACDTRDGAKDGIIGDWKNCTFDARKLIGTQTPCGTFTATDADVVNKIWAGPKDKNGRAIWFGLLPGAPFNGLNNTTTDAAGNTTGAPFNVLPGWFQYFLTQDPSWDWRTLTYDQFVRFFSQATAQYADLDVTSQEQPDLSGFRESGGKLVMWAGTGDNVVYQQGTVDYLQRVQRSNGGVGQVDRFARLFMAPGVGHCGGGVGAEPVNGFDALVAWVEHGKAPERLAGERADGLTRPICAYPSVATYRGHGDVTDGRNFRCAKDF